MGYEDPTEIIKQIYLRPRKRIAMLRPQYEEVGIAYCGDERYGHKAVIVYADKFQVNEKGRLAITEFKKEEARLE